MTRIQKTEERRDLQVGKVIMPTVTLDKYHKMNHLLVDHAMTNYDSSVITARSKKGIASMVAHLPDCLLVMSVQGKIIIGYR